MKIGRNAPCPCGSGKKYKHCCISVSEAVTEDLKELLADQEFGSMEEAQSAVDNMMAMQNQKPIDDFLGLSSECVFRMLNFSFDTPELFQFPELLSSEHSFTEPKAPILILMQGIVAAIDEKGLKATKARGSLPQKLCREMWDAYSKLYPDNIFYSFHKVNKEDDFFDLHVARVVLELAGFLRKAKGSFYVTKKYRKIESESGLKGLYPIIFKTYCREFNWSYRDGYDETPFIQQSFLFTLYLLKQYGENMTFTSVYEDAFLRAFPMLIDEMEESSYSTPEKDFRHCYYLRALKGFLIFLGLAELEVIKGDKLYDNRYKIKKTVLFDAVVHFNLIDLKTSKTIHLGGPSGIFH